MNQNHRWCIISGPRSGTNWLEDLIWTHFHKITRFSVKLGEIILPSSGYKHPITLGKSKIIIRTDNTRIGTPKEPQQFLQNQTDLILESNINQPAVMRVFCQTWIYSKDDYLDFFQKIQNCGFQFISLDRNLFDRAISWSMMEHTGFVHRYKSSESDIYTAFTDRVKPEISTEKIKIDVDKFVEYYKLCKIDTKERQDIEYMLPIRRVSYESLIQDCVDNNIPISVPDITIKKLYDEDYKDTIENYQELVEAASQLTEKETHE
jgi:hypothetical protein